MRSFDGSANVSTGAAGNHDFSQRAATAAGFQKPFKGAASGQARQMVRWKRADFGRLSRNRRVGCMPVSGADLPAYRNMVTGWLDVQRFYEGLQSAVCGLRSDSRHDISFGEAREQQDGLHFLLR